MSTLIGALILTGACLTVFFEWKRAPRPRAIAKTTASLLFLVLAVHDGVPVTTAGRLILAGLALSAVGDVLLLSNRRPPFLAGIGAFLLAHVAYSGAFLQHEIDLMTLAATSIALVIVGALVLRWLWRHVPAGMGVPVVAYVLTIGAMVVLAAGATAAGLKPMLLAGAVLFFLSDLAVARDRFVRSALVNRMWGLPTYYLAQILFALAAF